MGLIFVQNWSMHDLLLLLPYAEDAVEKGRNREKKPTQLSPRVPPTLPASQPASQPVRQFSPSSPPIRQSSILLAHAISALCVGPRSEAR